MFSVKAFVNWIMKNRFGLTWKASLKKVKASRKLVVGFGLFGENYPFPLMWKAFAKKVKALRKWVAENVYRRQSLDSNQPNSSSQEPRWFQYKIRIRDDFVVEVLVLLNVGVYVLWRVADRRFMIQNFMVSLRSFRSGHFHTMITSSFSHLDNGHIVRNMTGFYFHAKMIVRKLGPKFLLKLYLAGAITGSVFFLLDRAYKEDRCGHLEVGLLGASDAVRAIKLFHLFYNPTETFMGFILVIRGIHIVLQDFQLTLMRNVKVSGIAHLGGAAAAAIAWALQMKKLRRNHK